MRIPSIVFVLLVFVVRTVFADVPCSAQLVASQLAAAQLVTDTQLTPTGLKSPNGSVTATRFTKMTADVKTNQTASSALISCVNQLPSPPPPPPPPTTPTMSAAQIIDQPTFVRVAWANISDPAPTDRIELWAPNATAPADTITLGSPQSWVVIESLGSTGSLRYATWQDASLTYAFRYMRGTTMLATTPQVSIVSSPPPPPPPTVGTVSLVWTLDTDPAVMGYLVSAGTNPGTYPSSYDAGNAAQVVVPNLQSGTVYYFVLQAYDAARNMSGYSNEASGVAK